MSGLIDRLTAASRMAEVERLLNDPEVPMQAARVWELMAELAKMPEGEFDRAGPLSSF